MQEISTENRMLLAGKYELRGKIGEGGFGIVYLAWDRNVGRLVAIKAQKEHGKEGSEEILRNEMEILKSLSHPMLPAVYDFFCEDRWHIVMEYVEGESLHDVIKREGKIEEKQACEWAGQLLGLLAYMHGRRPPMVYRDLKPENIIVCPDGSLKAVDFGTAFAARHDCGGRPYVKKAGTVGYAAPEQLNGSMGGSADERSDIYAFGAVLHHMLTGSIPEEAAKPAHESAAAAYGSAGAHIRSAMVCDSSAYAYGNKRNTVSTLMPEELGRIIRKCTAADADMRYQSALDVQRDLERIRYREGSKRDSLLFKIERKVWLTDKKAAGLLGICMLVGGMLAGGLAVQASGNGTALPVTVYNKQGQKLIIRGTSVYKTDGSLVFELAHKAFTGDGAHRLSISLTNSDGDMQERTFYIQYTQMEEGE